MVNEWNFSNEFAYLISGNYTQFFNEDVYYTQTALQQSSYNLITNTLYPKARKLYTKIS